MPPPLPPLPRAVPHIQLHRRTLTHAGVFSAPRTPAPAVSHTLCARFTPWHPCQTLTFSLTLPSPQSCGLNGFPADRALAGLNPAPLFPHPAGSRRTQQDVRSTLYPPSHASRICSRGQFHTAPPLPFLSSCRTSAGPKSSVRAWRLAASAMAVCLCAASRRWGPLQGSTMVVAAATLRCLMAGAPLMPLPLLRLLLVLSLLLPHLLLVLPLLHPKAE